MLIVVENCPVQYRAPFYAEVQSIAPGAIKVLYQSEGATRSQRDKEFGSSFAWDIPLLEGYDFEVLPSRKGRWKRVWTLLRDLRTTAVLLTDFENQISKEVYILALLIGIPLWMRMETQDNAYRRSPAKSFARKWIYRSLYSTFRYAFSFGKLNRVHLERHGFRSRQLATVPYVVSNPILKLPEVDKQKRRASIRDEFSIPRDAKVVSFFGKFIPKKNPELLLQAHNLLTPDSKRHIHYLFVGSGELESSLQSEVASLNCNATFTGFINQSRIHDFYLASDILCLPSRQMGEVWGLSVNEGLQAGNGVIISEHVGCVPEFYDWERVRVCTSEDAESVARCIESLLPFPNNFDWCRDQMSEKYSIPSAAASFAKAYARWNGIRCPHNSAWV